MTYSGKYLAIETDYRHQIDAYQRTKGTRAIQRQTIKRLGSMRRPQSLSQSRKPNENKSSDKNSERLKHKNSAELYNKWYINPEHHFKQHCKNPKNDKKMLNNEQYVYNNLRNQQFWNWVHPFESNKLPALKAQNSIQKIDPKALEGFKKYIEQSTASRRLPSIVEYILSHKKKSNQQNLEKQ